jgi:hypothetical protein
MCCNGWIIEDWNCLCERPISLCIDPGLVYVYAYEVWSNFILMDGLQSPLKVNWNVHIVHTCNCYWLVV